jgi:hypothetical protein
MLKTFHTNANTKEIDKVIQIDNLPRFTKGMILFTAKRKVKKYYGALKGDLRVTHKNHIKQHILFS